MHNDFLIYIMYFLIISNVIAFKTPQVLSTTDNKIFALTDLTFQCKHDCVKCMLSLNIKIIYEGLLSVDFPGGSDG